MPAASEALDLIWGSIAEMHSSIVALAVLVVVTVLWVTRSRRQAALVLGIAALVPFMGTGPARDVQQEPHYFLVPLAVGAALLHDFGQAFRWFRGGEDGG